MAMVVIGEAAAMASLIGAPGRFKLGLKDAANMAGQLMVRRTQSGMDSAGGGRLYPKARRQASAPGSPYPAVQSGQLYGSLGYTVEGSHALRFGSSGAFNRGYDYAIGVHEETEKMEARPYLTSTVNRTRAEVESLLGEVTFRRIVGG